MVSGITFSSHTAENQAAYASYNTRFQESVASQRAKIANQIPTEVAESQKASVTEQATRVDTALSAAAATAANASVQLPSADTRPVDTVEIDHANLATAQAPASDSLVGASTYNSQGAIHPVHSGTGQIFSASA